MFNDRILIVVPSHIKLHAEAVEEDVEMVLQRQDL